MALLLLLLGSSPLVVFLLHTFLLLSSSPLLLLLIPWLLPPLLFPIVAARKDTTIVSVKRRTFWFTGKWERKISLLVGNFKVWYLPSCNKSMITCSYSTTSKAYWRSWWYCRCMCNVRSFCSYSSSLIYSPYSITSQPEHGDMGRWDW